MNAFHVCGAIFAIWALIVAGLGITREDFPGGAEKIVGLISVVLMLAAVGTAIYTSAVEEEEHEPGEARHEAGLVIPLLP